MAFDPDKYLNKVEQKSEFDPDSYLSEAEAQEDPGYLSTIAHKLPAGLTLGHSDEILAALQSPVGAYKTLANIMGSQYPSSETESYTKPRDVERAKLAKMSELYPGTSLTSEIAGGIIPAVGAAFLSGGTAVPALAGAAGAGEMAAGAGALGEAAAAVAPALARSGIKTAAIEGLLGGAAAGEGQSEESTLPGVLKDTAVGSALGGVTGTALGGAGKLMFGNKGDIARGALPAGTAETGGAWGALKGSRLGQIMSGISDASEKGIKLTPEATAARGVEMGELATEAVKAGKGSIGKLSREIGGKVEAGGAIQVPQYEKALAMLPQEVEEEVLKTIPGKKVSNAPAELQQALAETEEKIRTVVGGDLDQAVKSFQKSPTDLVGQDASDALFKELPYSKFNQNLTDKIRTAVQENPEERIEEIIKSVISRESPGESALATGSEKTYEDLLDAIKVRKKVNQLLKEAAGDPQKSETAQALSSLLDQRQALKKTISAMGTSSTPEQQISTMVKKFETSHIAPGEEKAASELANIFRESITPDGSVIPGKSAALKDTLFNFSGRNQNTQVGSVAKEMANSIKDIRTERAGPELMAKFHKLKTLANTLGANTKMLSDEQIRQDVAPAFAKVISGSEKPSSAEAGQMSKFVDEFLELHNDPTISENVKQIRQLDAYNRLEKFKRGPEMSTNLMERFGIVAPAEAFGSIKGTAPVKYTSELMNKLSTMNAEGWNKFANISGMPQSIKSRAEQMAKSPDEPKRRAIMNMLNQMPTFRKNIAGMLGVSED